ncbi:HNH endonuclease signature motif containing protein [Corynebacterium sp. AOP40-9SA-29]|uniref:HNH endonuclease signature motif containing protein n=1 Tax=Corynebacterium sp. AOP40-9SA-29 TaxID=3457677 RepID=UPI0040345C7B
MTDDNTTPTMSMDDIQRHLNLGEMLLIAKLRDIAATERFATALALRGRSRTDASRFAHAGELAARNLELFCAVLTTGILAADHLALIRRLIHAQLDTVPTAHHDEITAHLDAAVNKDVTPWLRDTTELVTLRELRDRVRAAILDAAPELANDTALAQEDTATLKRRGKQLVLTGGDEVTLAAIDDELDKKARVLLADARRQQEDIPEDQRTVLPTRSQLKAQVLLEQLGDNPASMKIRVNLYRATLDGIHGTGAGYVTGVGWIDPSTAQRLENESGYVRVLHTNPDKYPDTEAYSFTTAHKDYLDGRDATCRFPNCDVPATLCDNDHIINSPHTDPTSDGITHPSNGQKLCRPHHRLKTEGVWTCSTTDDGFTIDWQGPNDRRYTTHATGPLAQAYDPDAVYPAYPDEPTEPVEPAEPTEPVEPTEPAEPSEPEGPDPTEGPPA